MSHNLCLQGYGGYSGYNGYGYYAKKIHLRPNHKSIRVIGYASSHVSTGYGG